VFAYHVFLSCILVLRIDGMPVMLLPQDRTNPAGRGRSCCNGGIVFRMAVARSSATAPGLASGIRRVGGNGVD
jgi:hypothetical protein